MAKSLEERIQRLEDTEEVQKLMSRYAYLNTAHMHDECVQALFSKKTAGQKDPDRRLGDMGRLGCSLSVLQPGSQLG